MYSSFNVDIKYIAIKVIAIILIRLFKNFDIRNIKNVHITKINRLVFILDIQVILLYQQL